MIESPWKVWTSRIPSQAVKTVATTNTASSEHDNDDPKGRGEEGDGGRETLMEGVDSSDEDDGGKSVLHKTNSSPSFCS